jgi:cation-transporting P-type ATPase I
MTLARTAAGLTGGTMRSAGRVTTTVVREVGGPPARLGARAARSATRTPWDLTANARRDVVREASSVARGLAKSRPARAHRRIWADRGRAHIEVRGLAGHGPRHRRLADDVLGRLNRLRGVRWAEINAVTGQVLVAFDEGRVDVASLVEAVHDAEAARGTREQDLPWGRPLHPDDATPIAAAATELAADCVAVVAAIGGRVFRVPTIPSLLQAGVALLEVERPLRRQLKRRVGPLGTDVVMAMAVAGVAGLSQNPGTPAVDALYRSELLVEAVSRRYVWRRRRPELADEPEPAAAQLTDPAPNQELEGPIEEWIRHLGPGALAASGVVLALTRSPGRAVDALLATVPKATTIGRGGFAATAAVRLAGANVLALNAAAFRRLDRISAIVVDSTVLSTDRTQVLAAQAAPGHDDADVWRIATQLTRDVRISELDGGPPMRREEYLLEPDPGPDPPGARRLVVRRDDERLGTVVVGHELDGHAEAVIEAARATGARLLLTDDASATDLLPRTDEVIGAGEPLVEAVRRLQADGAGVLAISRADPDALAAADVGVSVDRRGAGIGWSADLVCGPDLVPLWRILRVTAAARPVSEHTVRLAKASATLGVLLAMVGGRGRRRSPATAPVYTAAFVALTVGTAGALRAASGPAPAAIRHVPWHALEPSEVVARLAATNGTRPGRLLPLSHSAARLRRTLDRGPVGWTAQKALSPARGAIAVGRASREELRDPLTPVLAVGAAASAIVGSGVDAVLVGGVMTGNTLIGATQRVRAERAIRGLLLQQETSARRVRADAETVLNGSADGVDKVAAGQLSVGDVIALSAADVVPADARLLTATDLEVDESTLTGESLPVAKQVAACPAAPLAERGCMVYQGTTILAGSAYALVVATGGATEAGRASRAGGRTTTSSGIQARLAELTRIALPVTVVGGAAVTGLSLLRSPLRSAVAAGVSIAVAAVPEGLPLVATVAQASAARRLSRRQVLVRSSRTLEALGRVDTICFDKTGTLTEGRLAVSRIASADDLASDSTTSARILTTAARACPPATGETARSLPHATDRAIVEAAAAADDVETGWQLEAELPFETNRGYSAALGRDDRGTVLVVKGAPEVVLPLCDGAVEPEQARRTADRLAADGLRVLAVAERRLDGSAASLVEDLEDTVVDLSPLGFVGIADRPRQTALDAVDRLKRDGLRVVMVTGDHPLTARAVAAAVGIDADVVVNGPDLSQMTESERVRRVAEASVFARVSPEQKVRIVEAMHASGRVVAMTGDGTNDAAAIRLADVGIGVAASRSTAARSAADLVIADDDVSRIHDAVVEGRALWRRVRDAVSILVGGNAGEVGFMILGTALSGRAPISVRQVLLVNMLTDMFPALAVAVASHRDQPAVDPEADPLLARSVLGDDLGRVVAIRGATTAVGATSAWAVGRLTGRARRAGTMGLAALVCTQLGQTLVMGRHSRLVIATSLLSAGALFVIVETPVVSQFFGSTPLGPVAWSVVLGCSAGATLLSVAAPRMIDRARA